MSLSHPGFNAVASRIAAREGMSKNAADAVLASSSRKASPAAKKKNKNLKKVLKTKKPVDDEGDHEYR